MKTFPLCGIAKKKSKLWLFNLHYFRDLSNITDDSQQELMETIFQNWIEKNPLGLGVGWSLQPFL